MESARVRMQNRLVELKHDAKKSLGQNFLVSDHVIAKIIQATELSLNDLEKKSLIEIGPGLGAITDYLVDLKCDYQAIELDTVLFQYWENKKIKIINQDALQADWSHFDSDILVSNLPYQISSSIVIEKSLDPYKLKIMILMFQKEVAQRIRALCKTDHYGMLSVMAQEFWKIETVCDAGPVDFFPPPKVASRVLKFHVKDSDILDRKKYLAFIKQCFHQRRRILKSNLPSQHSELVLQWLAEQKMSEKARAEELSPDQFKKLYLFLNLNEKINS
jgi:16S rRNA (adenine1518-N6/adenine1519-N6)-dimethyltransferase